jgi:Rrf2 family protein
MVDIALQDGSQPVRRGSIAERQGISAEYVAQLFRALIAAGLANSTKGPGGGYRLSRPPAAIRAGDVIRAVEGPVAIVDCVAPSSRKPCPRMTSCVTHRLWQRLSGSMEAILDSVTLADLVAEANQLADDGECPLEAPI